MKILMTGVTSFTGCHIARRLLRDGHEVYGSLTRNRATYDASIEARLQLCSGVQLFELGPIGSSKWDGFLKKFSFDIFIHHGADIAGYRSPDFDRAKAVAVNTRSHIEVLHQLQKHGTQKMIYTGSFFEPDDRSPAIGPYGVAKFEIGEVWRVACESAGLAFEKVVIPNPIGPLENADRMFPSFSRQWLKGEKPVIKAPYLVRDSLPVEWLAGVYSRAINNRNHSDQALRPSGFVMSNLEFLSLFLGHLSRKREVPFGFIVDPVPSDQPGLKRNDDPVPECQDARAVELFFESWFRDLNLL